MCEIFTLCEPVRERENIDGLVVDLCVCVCVCVREREKERKRGWEKERERESDERVGQELVTIFKNWITDF